jgi:hypothetical protein
VKVIVIRSGGGRSVGRTRIAISERRVIYSRVLGNGVTNVPRSHEQVAESRLEGADCGNKKRSISEGD